jgi:hypothetical protein
MSTSTKYVMSSMHDDRSLESVAQVDHSRVIQINVRDPAVRWILQVTCGLNRRFVNEIWRSTFSYPATHTSPLIPHCWDRFGMHIFIWYDTECHPACEVQARHPHARKLLEWKKCSHTPHWRIPVYYVTHNLYILHACFGTTLAHILMAPSFIISYNIPNIICSYERL